MQYRKKVAVIYLLGFFVDLVNIFIASVAYPEIARTLNASVAELSWVSNAYILGLTLVIPLSAWLARAYGSKRIFMASLALFMVATVGAGASASLGALIGWRLLQGLGGGLLIPVGQTLAYQLYRPQERAGLSSMIMLVGLLAPALSPALGGWIVDTLGWRWIFFLNLPLAALTLLLAACWLQPERLGGARRPLDISGLASASLAILLILFGLTTLSDAGEHVMGMAVLAAGLLILVLYVRGNSRKAHPILNLKLLRDPLLKMAMLVYLFIPGVFMGVSLIAMFYLQDVLGMSASRTGALMLPWALAAFVAISLTGKVFNRNGPRPLFLLGALVQGAGISLLLGVTQADQLVLLVAAYMLMGFGGSLASSAAQSSAFLRTADEHLGQASALWNINRQLSFCLGVALLSVLLNLLLAWNDAAQLSSMYLNPRAMHVFHICFAVAAVSSVIPALLSLRIKNTEILQFLRK